MFGHDIPGLTVHWRPVARARRQQRRTRIGRTSMSRSHDSAPWRWRSRSAWISPTIPGCGEMTFRQRSRPWIPLKSQSVIRTWVTSDIELFDTAAVPRSRASTIGPISTRTRKRQVYDIAARRQM